MMVLDEDPIYDHEWVCRACGTRLYGTTPESAAPARISSENPIKDDNIGRPRFTPSDRRRIQNQAASKRYRAKQK